MKLSTIHPTRRSAFTLIELLVVMTILALLIALLAAGVFKTLNKVADVRNTRELRDLRTGIVNFQGKYGIEYVPSAFVLCSKKDDYFSDPPADTIFKNQLYQDSFAYLSKVWKQINWATPQPAGGPPTWVGIDWNGSGQPSSAVTLEGDQCLVFFLGGLQTTSANGTSACIGFSTNKSNPASLTGDRVEPFFDFQSNRLKRIHTASDPNNIYFSYLDAYEKKPFVYFSSYKKANGYDRYRSAGAWPNYTSDCPTLGVLPYVELLDGNGNPFKYYNSDTFQIISAGRDGAFGPGYSFDNSGNKVPWSPAKADQIVPQGRDDMSDFFDRMLGVPSN